MGEESVNNGPELICRRVSSGVVLTFKEQSIYDIIAVENVEAQIRAILDEKPSNMVINFSGVDFMVTRVINVLVVALKNVRSRGGEVYLTGMNQNIRGGLELINTPLSTSEIVLADLCLFYGWRTRSEQYRHSSVGERKRCVLSGSTTRKRAYLETI